jgi:hypothetical protein
VFGWHARYDIGTDTGNNSTGRKKKKKEVEHEYLPIGRGGKFSSLLIVRFLPGILVRNREDK